MRNRLPTIRVLVADFAGTLLPKAKAFLKPLGGKAAKAAALRFDARAQAHVARDLPPGRYLLEASATGLAPDKREVEASPAGLEEVVVLGKRGMPFYYRGRVKVPFEPRPNLLAVSLAPAARGKEEELDRLARELDLAPVEVARAVVDDGVRVFRLPARTSASALQAMRKRLAAHPLVARVGAVVRIAPEGVAFLTDELVVRFKPQVVLDDVPAIARKFRLAVERPIPYAGNAFVMRGAEPSYGLLQQCEALVRSGLVEYAEPNLVATMVDDQVNPTDFLVAQQWHIGMVGLPDAWDALQGLNAPGVAQGDPGDLTFGSENLVIAVLDRGIRSQTVAGVTSAAHPDFAGPVTGGAAKVYQFFDFVNMVANNNNPPNDHGMGCAGVATARANNASVVAGEDEGVVGAAPNCRVMGLIRPAGGTEVQYADAYIWAAGFNPQSTQAGFPAPIAPGADVITNSFGESIGMAISGLMRDCLDFLTTYGRGGRGVVLCFSAGNGNTNFVLQRPWAAYAKTIAVAASTNADVRAGYSNFGTGIDLCAPSSDGVGVVSCALPGAGNLAGHTGGPLDYRNDFGGTSSATPFVASVAALLLSARPALTWVEVRQILRDTAFEIDLANTDPTGQWIDSDGDGVNDYSQWYGFGRLDAEAAVNAAIAYGFNRDLLVRDSLADVGAVPVAGVFWDSPDLWVRNASPAVDGAAALPANYATPGPHQSPVANQDNWLYVRLRNIGAAASYPAYVRVYLTHFAGSQFAYPDDYVPTNRPGQPVPMPLVTGTYLLGEIALGAIAAGTDTTVNVVWPQALVPPQTVMMGGLPVTWHPCLLVEVSPQDGPAATGAFVWDNNNLAQKNLSIVYPDDDAFASGFVLGHRRNRARYYELVLDRARVPASVRLYVEILDRQVLRRLRDWLRKGPRTIPVECCEITLLEDARIRIGCAGDPDAGIVVTLPKSASLALPERGLDPDTARKGFTLGYYRGRPVLWLAGAGAVRIPIFPDPGALVPVVVGGVLQQKLPTGAYRIELAQRDAAGRTVGGVSVDLTLEPTGQPR